MDLWQILVSALAPLSALFLVALAAFGVWVYRLKHPKKEEQRDIPLHNLERSRSTSGRACVPTTMSPRTIHFEDEANSSQYSQSSGRQASNPPGSSPGTLPPTPTHIPSTRAKPLIGPPPRTDRGNATIGLSHSVTSNPPARSSSRGTSSQQNPRLPDRKAPSPILEEDNNDLISPFDTPDKYRVAQNQEVGGISRNKSRGKTHARTAAIMHLPPLKPDLTHPDLLPRPLIVFKRGNSVRENSSNNIGVDTVRRSASDAAAERRQNDNRPAIGALNGHATSHGTGGQSATTLPTQAGHLNTEPSSSTTQARTQSSGRATIAPAESPTTARETPRSGSVPERVLAGSKQTSPTSSNYSSSMETTPPFWQTEMELRSSK